MEDVFCFNFSQTSSFLVKFMLESSLILVRLELQVRNGPRGSDGGRGQTSFYGDELWPVLVRVFRLVVLHVLK